MDQLVYPFICWWTRELFLLFGYYEQYSYEYSYTIFCVDMSFLLDRHLRMKLLTYTVILFNFLRKFQTVFQSIHIPSEHQVPTIKLKKRASSRTSEAGVPSVPPLSLIPSSNLTQGILKLGVFKWPFRK